MVTSYCHPSPYGFWREAGLALSLGRSHLLGLPSVAQALCSFSSLGSGRQRGRGLILPKSFAGGTETPGKRPSAQLRASGWGEGLGVHSPAHPEA